MKKALVLTLGSNEFFGRTEMEKFELLEAFNTLTMLEVMGDDDAIEEFNDKNTCILPFLSNVKHDELVEAIKAESDIYINLDRDLKGVLLFS